MNELKKLKFELGRYSFGQKITFFLDPAILALVNFRLAAFFYNVRILYILYRPIWRIISNNVGIEIHGCTKIGKGLKICHFGGIFINSNSVIGENMTIYNDVVIGSKEYEGGKSPTIGDNVSIGVGAKVLGEINIGNNVKIGAMSVVLKDCPSDSTVVGNPGNIINKTNK